MYIHRGERGGQIGANVSLFIKPITGYHPKRSVSSVITIRKDWKPLNNEEQKMVFCVFSSTFCHSREIRVWLWNLQDAISWAIIKWNWSARVYKINTTQNKHTTLNTDNTGFQQSTADFVHVRSTISSISLIILCFIDKNIILSLPGQSWAWMHCCGFFVSRNCAKWLHAAQTSTLLCNISVICYLVE